MNYNFTLLPEYDKQLKLNNQDFLGFSKKKFKKYVLGKNYYVVGEVKKEKVQNTANTLVIGGEQHNIKPFGTHNALFNKKIGYVCVGGDNYVAIIKSRLPFLITFVLLLAAIVATGLLLWSELVSEGVPTLSPDHPLPDVDTNIEEILGDNNTPNSNINEGGGAVSMIYTLEANIDLSDNNMDVLFKNPNKSNHDVALELYITKNGNRTLISKSGRIPAGNMLRTMSLIPDSAVLGEGVYQGVYKVIYYNPQTGERALIESDITDVTVSVKQ